MYIQVGNKKRAAFHAFNRYRMFISPEKQSGYYCGSLNKYGENFMVSNWIWSQPTWPNTTGTYWSGDVCPFISKAALTNYGNYYRDFVVRDLFVKANAPVFDGAVFIAELQESLVEIKRILGHAVEGLHKTASLKAKLRHALLSPEELWLWWRYFLMPAMLDAEAIMQAINGRMRIERVQDGDRSDGYQSMEGTGYYHGLDPAGIACQWTSNYRYGAGGAIDMYTRFDPNPFGTSGWDVVRAVWERIPWSFVFDWFVNVGDWLASLREIDIDYAQSYATFAIEAETQVKFPQWVMDKETVTYKALLIDRIIDLEPPAVPLVDKEWGRTLRYIDSISLTIGVLKRILTRR
jgi:hypothetical protein